MNGTRLLHYARNDGFFFRSLIRIVLSLTPTAYVPRLVRDPDNAYFLKNFKLFSIILKLIRNNRQKYENSSTGLANRASIGLSMPEIFTLLLPPYWYVYLIYVQTNAILNCLHIIY